MNNQEKWTYTRKKTFNQHNPAAFFYEQLRIWQLSEDFWSFLGFTSRWWPALLHLGRFGLVCSGEQEVEGHLHVIVVIQQGLSGRLTVKAHLHDVPQSSLINLQETAATWNSREGIWWTWGSSSIALKSIKKGQKNRCRKHAEHYSSTKTWTLDEKTKQKRQEHRGVTSTDAYVSHQFIFHQEKAFTCVSTGIRGK